MRTEIYFNSIDELSNIIDNSDKDQNIYLRNFFLGAWNSVRNQDMEVLFIPLGHKRYLRVFLDMKFLSCDPGGGDKSIRDMMFADFVRIVDLNEVTAYIAEEIFYNTEEDLKYEIHIGNKKYIASDMFFKEMEK